MNEAECLLKNYGDRGGRITPSEIPVHNSSYDTKAAGIQQLFFYSFKIISSLIKNIARTCLPPSIH